MNVDEANKKVVDYKDLWPDLDLDPIKKKPKAKPKKRNQKENVKLKDSVDLGNVVDKSLYYLTINGVDFSKSVIGIELSCESEYSVYDTIGSEGPEGRSLLENKFREWIATLELSARTVDFSGTKTSQLLDLQKSCTSFPMKIQFGNEAITYKTKGYLASFCQHSDEMIYTLEIRGTEDLVASI